jgi:hypothetical protein
MEAVCPAETFVNFNALHGIRSQKTVLFIITDVRSSNQITISWSTEIKVLEK